MIFDCSPEKNRNYFSCHTSQKYAFLEFFCHEIYMLLFAYDKNGKYMCQRFI